MEPCQLVIIIWCIIILVICNLNYPSILFNWSSQRLVTENVRLLFSWFWWGRGVFFVCANNPKTYFSTGMQGQCNRSYWYHVIAEQLVTTDGQNLCKCYSMQQFENECSCSAFTSLDEYAHVPLQCSEGNHIFGHSFKLFNKIEFAFVQLTSCLISLFFSLCPHPHL